MVIVCFLVISTLVADSYYQLVLQWPPTYCVTVNYCSSCSSPHKFTIHGSWPSDTNTNWKPNCTVPFLNSPIGDQPGMNQLLPMLLKEWPDLKDLESPDSFWKYQWNKHGWCTYSNVSTYFNTTLALKRTGCQVPKLGGKCGFVHCWHFPKLFGGKIGSVRQWIFPKSGCGKSGSGRQSPTLGNFAIACS